MYEQLHTDNLLCNMEFKSCLPNKLEKWSIDSSNDIFSKICEQGYLLFPALSPEAVIVIDTK